MLMRDVEMVDEQQQQLTELIDKLQSQKTQMRQFMSCPPAAVAAAADDDDVDDQTSSVDDFDLMAAASLGESDDNILADHYT